MKSLLSAFGLISLLCMNGCTDLSHTSDGTSAEQLPEQELYDATITFYQDERVTSILQAGRIRKFPKQSSVYLDSGVVVDFFNEEGIHTAILWSDSGWADEVRKDMRAMGNVIAISDSGEQLETQFLSWDNRTRRIISDAPVKFSTPTDTIYGTGFVSDENLKNWKIERPQAVSYREHKRRVAPDADSLQNRPEP